MHEGLRFTWWAFVTFGFIAGAYFHWSLFRHLVHWILVKVLQGFIWLLQKSDTYRKKVKVNKTKLPKTKVEVNPLPVSNKDGLEVDSEELIEWLKNPDVSVSRR